MEIRKIGLIVALAVLLAVPSILAVTTYLETSAISRIVGESPSELAKQMQRDEITINDATYYTTDIDLFSDKQDILEDMFGSNLNSYLSPWPGYINRFDWGEVLTAVNDLDHNELFILESEGDIRPLIAKSGSNKLYVNDVRNWQDSFESNNPLMIFDSPYGGSYLPKQDTFVSRLVRDSTIISSSSFNTNQFAKSVLCQLVDGKTVGEVYRDARNFHYNGGSKTNNGNFLGLILQSYSLYGNPLQELNIDWSEADRQSIRKKCSNFLENLAPDIEYIGEYGSYSVFRKHVYFEISQYNILDMNNISLINATDTYQDYVLYDLVLPKAIRTTKFPTNTIFLNMSLDHVYDDYLLSVPNLASFEGELMNRTCQYESLNYSVDFYNSYADYSQDFVADIKPVEVLNCSAGDFKIYTKFNYSVDYIVMSPVLIKEVDAPAFVYSNEPILLDISVMQLEDTAAYGSLVVFDGNNNKLWEYEVINDTLEYQALFYAPAEEGMQTFSVEFIQDNETMHYNKFETYVTVLEILADVPASVPSSATIPVNFKSYYPDIFPVVIEYYLFNDTQLMVEEEFSFDAVQGSNLFNLNFSNLQKIEQSYTLTIEASYLGEEKTNSFALVTNNAPLLAISASRPNYEYDEVLVMVEYQDIDGDTVAIAFDDPNFVQNGDNYSWITSVGDRGNYSVTMSASDGILTTARETSFEVKKYRTNSTFYGSVTFDNGSFVDDNSSVLAYINDSFYAVAYVQSGNYGIVITEDDIETEWKDGGEAGDIIEFYVEGANAVPMGVWSNGGYDNIDLVVALPDNLPPTINSISATSPQGFGAPVTIRANADDPDGSISSLVVEVTNPRGGVTNHMMMDVGNDWYEYEYTNYLNGTYDYIVCATDNSGQSAQNSSSFDMFVNLWLYVETSQYEYYIGDTVELVSTSYLENHGPDSIPYIEMKVQYVEPGTQPVDIATVYSSTPIDMVNYSYGDVADLWNSNPWNSTGQQPGQYRVYASLLDDQGGMLSDYNGTLIQYSYPFNLTNVSIVCYEDTDCPDGEWTTNPFCDGASGSLLRTRSDYTCVDAGSPQSACVEEVTNWTWEVCDYGCNQQTDTCNSEPQEVNLHMQIKTLKDEYELDEMVNLTDPPVNIILKDPDTENIKDSRVSGEGYANGAYGTDDELRIGMSCCVPYTTRSYLMFDITQIPTNATVLDATLNLYKTDGNIVREVYLHQVFNNMWTSYVDGHDLLETEITWNNQPCGPNFTESQNCNLNYYSHSTVTAENDTWFSWDITSLINQELGNMNVSIVLKVNETEGYLDRYHRFRSKEGFYLYRPYLNVTYSTDAKMTPEENQSKLVNLGNDSVDLKLQMKVQRYDGQDWSDEDSIYEDSFSHAVDPQEIVALDIYWNPVSWDTSSSAFNGGLFRAYVAAINDSGQVIINGDGMPVYATYNFSVNGCTPDWQCTSWSECDEGWQNRTCTDANSCGTDEGKPEETLSCYTYPSLVVNVLNPTDNTDVLDQDLINLTGSICCVDNDCGDILTGAYYREPGQAWNQAVLISTNLGAEPMYSFSGNPYPDNLLESQCINYSWYIGTNDPTYGTYELLLYSEMTANSSISDYDYVSNITIEAEACTPSWSCLEWTQCLEGTRYRYCFDQNQCGTDEGKPDETESCQVSNVIVLRTPELENLADVRVTESDPDSNWAHHNTLDVSNNEGTDRTKRSYLKFNTSRLINKTIIDADLYLYGASGTYTVPVDMHHVFMDGWTENSITWNNQPCGGLEFNNPNDCNLLPASSSIVGQNNGWYSWDVTDQVSSDITDDEQFSVVIKFGDEEDQDYEYQQYHGMDAFHESLIPYLYIVYSESQDEEPPVLRPIFPKTVNEMSTVMIAPVATDPNNDTLTFAINSPLFTWDAIYSRFSWRTGPTSSGFYQFIVNVTDGMFWDEETVNVTVNNKCTYFDKRNWCWVGCTCWDNMDREAVIQDPMY